MAGRGKQGTRRKKRSSFITKILLLLLLAAMGWRLYGLRQQVASAREERDRYEVRVQELERENQALAADIEEGATDEKMQEIARNELGLVLPDEYVFYNISG